jgi:hypothetical protein
MLRNVRAGGQGVKRGQFEGLKEGAREMKELRKRARAAERLRRYDDGQYRCLVTVNRLRG